MLLFIFSTVFVYAAPYPYALLENYQKIDRRFFNNLVAKKKATYMICIDGVRVVENQNKELEYNYTGSNMTIEQGREVFLNSLNNWLYGTEKYIQENNKQENLEEVISILNSAVNNIEEIPCLENEEGKLITQEPDLLIRFIDDTSKEAAWYTGLDNDIHIVKEGHKYSIENTLTHELGHAFGLADQYIKAIVQADFLYTSNVRRPSIMDCEEEHVTCDDIDGFIVSIYRTLDINKDFYSLCADGIFIENGSGSARTNKKYEIEESYLTYDAKIEFSKDEENNDYYLVDITLDNFKPAPFTAAVFGVMGFGMFGNSDFVSNYKVKIHGALFIKTVGDGVTYKKKGGLWSFVVYEKQDSQWKEKLAVMTDFFDEENNGILIDIENKTKEKLSDRPAIVPIEESFDFGFKSSGRRNREESPKLSEKDNTEVISKILEHFEEYK